MMTPYIIAETMTPIVDRKTIWTLDIPLEERHRNAWNNLRTVSIYVVTSG